MSDVPGQVENIQVTISHEIITISWSAAESNGAEIIDYHVRILSDGQEDISIVLNVTSVTLNRTELQPSEYRSMDVMYVVRVSARNDEGQGVELEHTFTLPAGMIVVCLHWHS